MLARQFVAQRRFVDVGGCHDVSGTMSIWARMRDAEGWRRPEPAWVSRHLKRKVIRPLLKS